MGEGASAASHSTPRPVKPLPTPGSNEGTRAALQAGMCVAYRQVGRPRAGKRLRPWNRFPRDF